MIPSSQNSWLDTRVSQLDVAAVADALHRSLPGPNSAILLEKAKARDWAAVAKIPCDPRAYSSAETYFRDAIASSLFKKVEDFPVDIDRKLVTFQKWEANEHQCYRTNQRLFAFLPGKVHHLPCDQGVSRHIAGIRKIIRSWIGDGPGELEPGFSPGSTLSERGRLATIAHKIRHSPSSTPQLDSLGYPGFVGTLWHHNMVDAGLRPSLVRGGEYFDVPKKFDLNRSAELQPTLNISLQLGAGRILRRKLRANTGHSLVGTGLVRGPGWDLRKAQDIHREVAMKASVDQSFCTIDLSSASDTIAKILVEILLPRGWFRLLDGLRTHYVTVPAEFTGKSNDSTYKLEKFSSMGNGFTFELETLIFAAVACYVSRHSGYWGELGFDVFVYGDDIIVRDELYEEVESVLTFMGFSLNQEKSFRGSHPFRESCGGDFFNGVNVRPTSFEKVNDLKVSEVIAVVNKIGHLNDRVRQAKLGDINRLWFHCLQNLPKGIQRIRGPASLGDNVVYDLRRDLWQLRLVKSRRYYDHFAKAWATCEVADEEILCLNQDSSESWLPWKYFDPATQLATAVLGFGDGLRGLLPRDPHFTLRTQWTTLSCVSNRP